MRKVLQVLFAMLFATNVLAHSGPPVPEPSDLDTLMEMFGWDLEKMEVTSEKIADGFYVLFGGGGNIGLSIGEDGVFAVDDQFPQLVPKIRAEVRRLGGKGIDFVVNTHWHFDHAEGNLTLGPDGTWLIAHENSREMMKKDRVINLVDAAYMQKAYPENAWPDITYDDDMQFHLNGQTIDLWHFGPAHTTGDTAVYFRGTDAVHLGDVYNNTGYPRGYPFIDVGNGGSLDGVIHFCAETLKRVGEDTVVIPGHGPVAGYDDLVGYVEMLRVIRDRIVALVEKGATLEEVYAARPTADYDEKMGDNRDFINRAYMGLTHRFVE